MAIKSTRQDSGNAGNDYPKLMQSIHNRAVVLFEEGKTGVVVAVSETHLHKVGDHATNWDMSSFTDYHGSITLENDKGK